MIEGAKIWNEPNNKSHWDPALDPEWAKDEALLAIALKKELKQSWLQEANAQTDPVINLGSVRQVADGFTGVSKAS